MQKRLSELIRDSAYEYKGGPWYEQCAEYLAKHNTFVLPCEAGDTIFVICNLEVQETKALSVSMEAESGKYVFFVKAKAVDGTNQPIYNGPVPVCHMFVFGKTAFTNKEDALKAFQGGEVGE